MRFFKWLFRKKVKPFIEESEESDQSFITIYFDGIEDIAVSSDIKDMSAEAASVLTTILVSINNGDIFPFIIESLRRWQKDDLEKKEFLKSVDALLSTFILSVKEEKDEEVVVRASNVFKFEEGGGLACYAI